MPLAFTLGEIEIPALAQERMEELREQFGQLVFTV